MRAYGFARGEHKNIFCVFMVSGRAYGLSIGAHETFSGAYPVFIRAYGRFSGAFPGRGNFRSPGSLDSRGLQRFFLNLGNMRLKDLVAYFHSPVSQLSC